MTMDDEITETKPAATETNEEGGEASNLGDANDNLAVPYGFPHSRVVHYDYDYEHEANSLVASKSTDEMTEREIANASDLFVDVEYIEPTAVQTETAPKSCYNYFAQADLESSCNSLSDYPTDEQTSNTLNTLNSFHRNMFGIDDAPSKASQLNVLDQTLGQQSLLLKDANINKPVGKNTVRVASNQSIASNQGDFNARVKKNSLMNRLHILQMAKRGMAVASRTKDANQKHHQHVQDLDTQDATYATNENLHNMQSAHMAVNAAAVVSPRVTIPAGQESDSAPTSSSTTNVVHEHERSDEIQHSEESPNVVAAIQDTFFKISDPTAATTRLGHDGCPEDSNDGQANDATTVEQTPGYNDDGGDKSQLDMPGNHQDYGYNHGTDEDSFLEDAVIENASPSHHPASTDLDVFNDNTALEDNHNHIIHQRDTLHSPYPQDCYSDESLSNYNIHASTLSLSTVTSTNNTRNAFANVGGDMVIYSPSNRTLLHQVNSSFETSASPLTVVASGGRPRMLDSREPSVASTVVDEMILSESYLAVRNLGAANTALEQHEGLQHTPVIQAAAITPLRKNANSNRSVETYSYSQAYLNSDNITSNPEIRSLSTTAPDATNIHEEYSFCPSSKHSSAYSTLTDEYLHYYDVPRRTGITAVAEEKECEIAAAVRSEEKAPELRKISSGPVDLDANAIVTIEEEENFRYESSSLARPPQPLPHHESGSWMYNSEHLSSIIQYPPADVGSRRGEGEGYVDEEAAMRYASLHRSGRGFRSSSSCMIRLLVLSAIILLMVSVASVTFGVILQKDSEKGNAGPLLGRPYSAQGGEGTALAGSGNEISGSDATGFVPAEPGSFTSPTFSPTVEETVFTASSESTNPLSVSQAPSPDPTFEHHMQAIDELSHFPSSEPTAVIATSAPSKIPTPIPTAHPSSSPTIRTMSPTPLPSPAITLQTTNPSISQLSNQTDSRNPTRTITIQSSRDTYIKENSVNWNYGYSDFLRVDEDPRSIAVIAFDIDPINDLLQSSKRQYDDMKETQAQSNRSTQSTQITQIIEAKLRLYSIEGSSNGGTVYALSDARQWIETELTWDNAREKVNASGEVLIESIAEAIDEGVWYEVSVTSAFDCCVEAVGTMYLNILIRTNSTDGVTYASKEYESGMFAPELIVTFSTEMVSQSSSDSEFLTWARRLAHCIALLFSDAVVQYKPFIRS